MKLIFKPYKLLIDNLFVFNTKNFQLLIRINVPSIKHSVKSNLPREYKSSASVSNTFRNRPSLTHSWKRRWQVWYGGNLSGKSHHRAPERNIQSTPFKTSRAWRGGLPRVWTTSALSKSSSIKDHCSSVNSSRRAIGEVYQTIFEMASSYYVFVYFHHADFNYKSV